MPLVCASPGELERIYDARYEGDYMSGDAFSVWSHSGVELERVRDTLALIPAAEVRSILDYGCGQGEWSGELSRAFPQAEVRGIDISRKAIEKARARHPSARFDPLDGEQAPFPEASFDLVFSYHVLEHVLDIQAVAADMVRVLKPGGHLCAIFPCGNTGSLESNLVGRVRDGVQCSATGEPRFYYEDPTHLRRMTSDAAVDLFRRHGLEPRTAFYAHQRFGAIEWIARSGPGFVRELLNVRPAGGLRGRLELLALQAILRPLSLALRIGSLDRSRARTGARALAGLLLLPLRPAGRGVGRLLESMARREWERRRESPNGSAQFLVFFRPARRAPPVPRITGR